MSAKIIAGSLFLLAFTLVTVARIGETPQEIAARYGAAVVMADVRGRPTRQYSFNKFKVAVVFDSGKSVMETLTPQGNEDELDDEQCVALGNAIAGEEKWIKDESDPLNSIWIQQGQKASMVRRRQITGPDQLQIAKVEFLLEEKNKLSEEKLREAQAFGAPVDAKTNTVVEINPSVSFSLSATNVFRLTNGKTILGVAVSFLETGTIIRTSEGQYLKKISWSEFSQDSLKKLAENPRAVMFVLPFIKPTLDEAVPAVKNEITVAEERAAKAKEKAAKAKAETAAKTLKWHQELADKGDRYGQYRMGLRYMIGDGVPKDEAKARALFKSAADQGNQEAAVELKKLSPDSPQ